MLFDWLPSDILHDNSLSAINHRSLDICENVRRMEPHRLVLQRLSTVVRREKWGIMDCLVVQAVSQQFPWILLPQHQLQKVVLYAG